MTYVKPFGVGLVSGTIDGALINPIISKLSFANSVPTNLAKAGVGFVAKKFLKFNPMGLTDEYIRGNIFMAGTSGVNTLSNNTSVGW